MNAKYIIQRLCYFYCEFLKQILSQLYCNEFKSAIYNVLSGRHKYWVQHEDNMPRGSGSVDKAPDSHWTNASSKLEKRKYSII